MLVAAVACAIAAQAQSQTPGQSYQQWRQQVMSDYQNFRGRVLDHYADFLEGVWHEYESQPGLKRDETPKPKLVPTFTGENPGNESEVTLPTPVAGSVKSGIGGKKPNLKTGLPKGMKAPNPGVNKPQPRTEPAPEPVPEPMPAPEPEPVAVPECVPAPASEPEPVVEIIPAIEAAVEPESEPVAAAEPEPEPVKAETPVKTGDHFDFFGMDFVLPTARLKVADMAGTPAQIAALWRSLDSQPEARKLAKDIATLRAEYGLNGYMTTKAVENYVHQQYGHLSESARMVMMFYLLNNLGYDIRLGKINNRHNVLMVPYEEKIYGPAFWMIDNQRYYIIAPPSLDMSDRGGLMISTCDLPPLGQKGGLVSVKVDRLNLPYKPYKYERSYNGITLSGELNENMMPLFKDYPLMDMEYYAASMLDSEMRADLVRQVREQLGDKEKKQAVTDLLHFIQKGFKYEIDETNHGYEKPYFVEENFYYDRNDCEDRAVLFTYLLWNALGVDCQLLQYPGHEAASVSLDADLHGCSYDYGGKRFYISDPTYIRAGIGDCMPDYVNVTPEVDYYYHR